MELIQNFDYLRLGSIIVVLILVFIAVSLKRRKKSDDSKLKEEKTAEVVSSPQAIEPKATQQLISLEEALGNTRRGFFGKISKIFDVSHEISTHHIEEIEEVLYTSDLGPKTVQRFLGAIETSGEKINLDSLKNIFRSEISSIFNKVNSSLNYYEGVKPVEPQVWMIVGVNGAGKTTTIGKLSHHLAKKGLKVMIAAGDTFRAAAKDQLQVWAERSGVEYFSPAGVDSPSAVAFDAVKKAKESGIDILIVDTAGRLHTQAHLMEELKKMKRVIKNQMATAPHETLIVLDANSGQNALMQAKQFHEALGLTGVVLTKLDGTAKGGVAVGVVNELSVPVKLIGVGEGVEDLRPFNSDEFIRSII